MVENGFKLVGDRTTKKIGSLQHKLVGLAGMLCVLNILGSFVEFCMYWKSHNCHLFPEFKKDYYKTIIF